MNLFYSMFGILVGIALILDPVKMFGLIIGLIVLKFIHCKLMGVRC